jgi:predicted dehydrogenase
VRRHTIEVYGEGGMMLFRDDKPNEVEVWFKEKTGGYTGEAEIISLPQTVEEPWFNSEIREFLQCIQTGQQPDRNFDRALYIQTILDQILESCETGCTIKL